MPPRKRARGDSSAEAATQHPFAVAAPEARTAKLLSFVDAGDLCDGEVVCRNQRFPVSRLMLAATSDFFRAAFLGSMREGATGEVTLDDDLDPTCVKALLDYAHGAETISVSVAVLEALLMAADQLGFSELLPLVGNELCTTITASNCLNRLVLAGRHSLVELRDAALRVLSHNFGEVASPGSNWRPWVPGSASCGLSCACCGANALRVRLSSLTADGAGRCALAALQGRDGDHPRRRRSRR